MSKDYCSDVLLLYC